MIKRLCDICLREITERHGDVEIRVDAQDEFEFLVYCYSCFQARKNWKLIHDPLRKLKSFKKS
ncbi:hypothetical protein HY947_00430 [Candidatus Gottesmanbacteria bacterium]|nr:hypothetical protein [Candidatus Gottesmanbacteria bacterium]